MAYCSDGEPDFEPDDDDWEDDTGEGLIGDDTSEFEGYEDVEQHREPDEASSAYDQEECLIGDETSELACDEDDRSRSRSRSRSPRKYDLFGKSPSAISLDSEEALELVSWQVTKNFLNARVRATPSLEARVLAMKEADSFVRGYEVDGWVKLASEPGYIKIVSNGMPLLRRMEDAGMRVGSGGSCSSSSSFSRCAQQQRGAGDAVGDSFSQSLLGGSGVKSAADRMVSKEIIDLAAAGRLTKDMLVQLKVDQIRYLCRQFSINAKNGKKDELVDLMLQFQSHRAGDCDVGPSTIVRWNYDSDRFRKRVEEVAAWTLRNDGVLPKRAHLDSQHGEALDEARLEDNLAQTVHQWRVKIRENSMSQVELDCLREHLPRFVSHSSMHAEQDRARKQIEALASEAAADTDVYIDGKADFATSCQDAAVKAVGQSSHSKDLFGKKLAHYAKKSNEFAGLASSILGEVLERVVQESLLQCIRSRIPVSRTFFSSLWSHPEVNDGLLALHDKPVNALHPRAAVSPYFVEYVRFCAVKLIAKYNLPLSLDDSFFEDDAILLCLDTRILSAVAVGDVRKFLPLQGRFEGGVGKFAQDERLIATVSPGMRAIAVRIAMQNSPTVLNARCPSHITNPMDYWWSQIYSLEKKSDIGSVKICRGLRQCSGSHGVLPGRNCFDLSEKLFAKGEAWRRSLYSRNGKPHGSLLFWLPSDFLCAACQDAFAGFTETSLRDLAEADVVSWCGALLFRPQRPAQLRNLLIEEWQRFTIRAKVVDAALCGELSHMQDLLRDATLSAAVLHKSLVPHATAALVPEVIRLLPIVADHSSEYVKSVFGIRTRSGGECGIQYRAAAVPRNAREPVMWRDYTGLSTYVSPSLWCLRVMLRCCREYQVDMDRTLVHDLCVAEAKLDPRFQRIADDCDSNVVPLLTLETPLARDLKPAMLPSIDAWDRICCAVPAHTVVDIRKRILDERIQRGVFIGQARWCVNVKHVLALNLSRARINKWNLDESGVSRNLISLRHKVLGHLDEIVQTSSLISREERVSTDLSQVGEVLVRVLKGQGVELSDCGYLTPLEKGVISRIPRGLAQALHFYAGIEGSLIKKEWEDRDFDVAKWIEQPLAMIVSASASDSSAKPGVDSSSASSIQACP